MTGPEVVGLVVSPVARYVGRPRDGAPPAEPTDRVQEATIRAGLGILGDRYFGKRAHRRASVSLIAVESVERVAEALQTGPLDPWLTRRNILLRGVDVEALIGHDVELDSGLGPVLLRLHRPANPCAWMDTVLAPGAFRALRGHGGARAEPLTDGVLGIGPVTVRVL